MKQLQFFKIGFVVLVVLNLALVAFLLIGKPGGHRSAHKVSSNQPFKNEAITILNLNEDQQAEFLKLAQGHHQEMRKLEQIQKELVRSYFDGIANPDKETERQQLDTENQKLEAQKLKLTYLHFLQVKSLLTESQLPQFEKFVQKAIGRVMLDAKKPSRPPKDLKR